MKNITVSEFNALRPEDRLFPIIDDSTFITETWNADGRSRFYGINDFFVEVIYDRTGKRIVDVIAFMEGERLQRMTRSTVPSENES